MKKNLLIFATLLAAMLLTAPASFGQGAVRTGPDESVVRDVELEKDSLHNLEVARNYFKLKKAYVASLKRSEEILAGNPTFTRLDEVLYIAGKSASYLADGKGKQKPELYVVFDGTNKKTLTPDEFRSSARSYLTQLITQHPQSKFRDESEKELRVLGGPSQSAPAKP